VDLLFEDGHGTTVLLRVPLSAAVQRVILVGVGDEVVAMPIGRVERIDEVESAAIERVGDEAFVPIDGLPLPLLDLAALLAIAPGAPGPRSLVLLAELGGQRVALRFDRLLGQQDVFVKPVPPLLGPQPWAASASRTHTVSAAPRRRRLKGVMSRRSRPLCR
jgi:two-component system chemotaxis sensor kinase CheA